MVFELSLLHMTSCAFGTRATCAALSPFCFSTVEFP